MSDPPPLRAIRCPTCPDPYRGDRQTGPCALDCRPFDWDGKLVGPDLIESTRRTLAAESLKRESLKGWKKEHVQKVIKRKGGKR